MKFMHKNKVYIASINKCKPYFGLGLWFGYKFRELGCNNLFRDGKIYSTTEYGRTFALYLPFFIFAFHIKTMILGDCNAN
jgi:hypothetical protein